jgi:hypothetical protein
MQGGAELWSESGRSGCGWRGVHAGGAAPVVESGVWSVETSCLAPRITALAWSRMPERSHTIFRNCLELKMR